MKQVAVYARYSSDLQKATSIEDQIAMARRYAEARGWQVVEIFQDSEMSGRNARRPGFQALRAAANERRFDAVVIEALDRLTRRITDALSSFDLFTFQGIELHSVTEGQQDFYKVLLGAFGAQNFSQMVSEHTRRGMQGAVTRGRLHTSAYGYRKLEGRDEINREIDPDQARIVRRIFNEFSEGKSALAIAKGLNADRIPAPRGGSWDGSTLRGSDTRHEGILRNRLYVGIASVCKSSRSFHPETGRKKTSATPDDAVEHEYPELRIVPQDLWDAVQAELRKRGKDGRKHGNPVGARRNKYLLSGLLYCACCSKKYVRHNRTGYKCSEALKGACGNHATISQKRIEARVFAQLRQLFRSPDLVAEFDRALRAEREKLGGADLEAEAARLARVHKTATEARDNIMRAIEGGAGFDSFLTRVRALETEIAEIEGVIADLDRRRALQSRPLPDAATIYERALEQMEKLLGDPDLVDQAHGFLSILIRRIVLAPDPSAEHGVSVLMEADLGAAFQSSDVEGAPDRIQKIPC